MANSILSQSVKNNGIAVYNVMSNKIDFGEDIRNNHLAGDLVKYLDKAGENNNQVNIKVKFNSNASISEYINKINPDDHIAGLNFAHIKAKADGIVYYNWNQKFLLRTRQFDDRKYIVKSSPDSIDWILKEDSKVINGYECKKAVLQKIRNNILVNDTLTTIAWYAPSITLPIGPSRYIGLPGIIVELHEKTTSYYLNTIEFLEEVKIDLNAIEGKNISYEDFNKMRKKFDNILYKKLFDDNKKMPGN